jgi:tetratricopeptide (TPR) repeat protein
MRPFLALIQLIILVFGSWTLAYHLWLLAALPAGLIFIPFVLILAALLAFGWRHWAPLWQFHRIDRLLFFRTAVLSLIAGSLTAFSSRWHVDDNAYLHRALLQLHHLDEPFFRFETGLNITIPPLLNIVTTSQEHFIVMTAGLFRVDPLLAYQNLSAYLGALLLPVIYVVLYRHLGLSRSQATVAAAVALLFIIIDGNHLRSFGNWSLTRLWHGKVMLNALLIPASMVLAWRFLRQPTGWNWLLVALAGVCAVGLTNGGIVSVPITLLALSMAYVVLGRLQWSYIQRAVLLNIASIYCVLVALAIMSGMLTEWGIGIIRHTLIDDKPAWWELIGTWDWAESLYKQTMGSPTILLRNLLILSVLPLAALRKPFRWLLVGYSVALLLIFGNPLTGPFWLSSMGTPTHWRLSYLFPLAICAGLVVVALRWRPLSGMTFVRASLVTLILVTTLVGYHRSSISWNGNHQSPDIHWKYPWEPRLFEARSSFIPAVAQQLSEHHNVLVGPPLLGAKIGLLNPLVRQEIAHHTITRLRSVGAETELSRRQQAREFLAHCEPAYKLQRSIAFLASLEQGVNTLIVAHCTRGWVADLLSITPHRWSLVAQDQHYALFMREHPDQALVWDAANPTLLLDTYHALQHGDDRQVRDYLQQVTGAYPDWAPGWLLRAQLEADLGNVQVALANADRAITLDPDLEAAYRFRVAIYTEQQDWAQAEADLAQLLTLAVDDPDLYIQLGQVQAAQGDLAQAVTSLEQATAHDPVSARIYFDRAITYRNLGNLAAAIADLSHAIALEPDELDYYYWRGILYRASDDFDAALADFNHIIEQAPTYALAYHKRGLIHRQQGDWEQALADFDRTIELRPNFAQAYFDRGLVYEQFEALDQARADYEQVLELSDDPAIRQRAQKRLAAIT